MARNSGDAQQIAFLVSKKIREAYRIVDVGADIGVNKAVVRRMYVDVFSRGDMQAFDEVLDKNFIDHSPLPNQPPGSEGMRQMITGARKAFPDLKASIEEMVAEGDIIATRFKMTGTHKGSFMGEKPTGKQVTFTSMDFIRVRNGKAVEGWHQGDEGMVLAQLGVKFPGS